MATLFALDPTACAGALRATDPTTCPVVPQQARPPVIQGGATVIDYIYVDAATASVSTAAIHAHVATASVAAEAETAPVWSQVSTEEDAE